MAIDLSEDAIDAAIRRGEAEQAGAPVPTDARCDRETGRLVVEFENGAAFSVPARLIQDLATASSDELAAVALERGHALRWDALDVDVTVPGLLAGVFGTARFMAASAERARSDAKAAAARANGKKGCRPRLRGATAAG